MKNKVYLAGGLKSGWQDKVIDLFKDDFVFFNPLMHGLEGNSREYTTWDLHFLKQSDILFGYMEKDNPSGYGLALEIGFAKASNKTIILVDERSKEDLHLAKYYSMIHESCSVVFSSLEEGLRFLHTFSTLGICEE